MLKFLCVTFQYGHFRKHVKAARSFRQPMTVGRRTLTVAWQRLFGVVEACLREQLKHLVFLHVFFINLRK